jgi:phosphinothricin acetyltransferase
MHIRAASEADLPGILAIYNHVILTSTAVYMDEPVALEDRAAWLAAREARGFPVLVAAEAGEVLGFASYGEWRGAFPGYRHSVEHSVHVRDGLRGRGVGRALMEALIPLAQGQGMHVMLGAVDAANEGSLRFHERLGFARVAHFHEVGRKFGRWLDLVFVQRLLDAR